MLGSQRKAGAAVIGLDGTIAFLFEVEGHQIGGVGIVFDHQNGICAVRMHACPFHESLRHGMQRSPILQVEAQPL